MAMYCKRVRGLSWEEFSAQGDFFRKPSAEAQILADLFARSEDLRSFDNEEMESEAGKKRVFDFITEYLADYAYQAKVAGDPAQGLDMFGNAPTTLAEILQGQRDKPGADGRKRLSIATAEEIHEALNTDRTVGRVVKGGRHYTLGKTSPVLLAVGMREAPIYTKAHTLRKIVREHGITEEQIGRFGEMLDSPAVVFDDYGRGYIILTDELAPDENGIDAPVAIVIKPDETGGYIASAYSRKAAAEVKYVGLVRDGKVLYYDKTKVANLPLRGEAQSSLNTFSVGDHVVTPERVTKRNVPNGGGVVNGGVAGGEGASGRYSVIGELGATALDRAEEATTRMDNLVVARMMEVTGKDAKAVRLATGWERGAEAARGIIDAAVQAAVVSGRR